MSTVEKRRKRAFHLILLGIVIVIPVIGAEIFLRIFLPQDYMVPRYQYSPLYGHVLPSSTVMFKAKPGRWRFTLTVNEYGYRGKAISISNLYDKKNIVVLGDSYSMGAGVNDGEEYPSVLSRELSDRYDVINLGVGGYGLTQQIRRYYEFGKLYDPDIVIIQFSPNDPDDNYFNRVATVEDGRFRFWPSEKSPAWLKDTLSNSVVQYSQLYNIFRQLFFKSLRKRDIEQAAQASGAGRRDGEERQRFYNELLGLFVKNLSASGIHVIYISVNGGLTKFALINETVLKLDEENYLNYVEVADWFVGIKDYGTPEGHRWGVKGHEIIGENLAKVIGHLESEGDWPPREPGVVLELNRRPES